MMQDFENPRRAVKFLILLTIVISLASPLLSFFFQHFFQLAGPVNWFPLSLATIKKGWLWQPLTAFFVQSADVHITLSFLITLSFQMFLFWFAGREIAVRFGTIRFLILYFTAGLFASLFALGWMWLTKSSAVVFGSSGAVFALLVVWAMIHKNLQLYYFTSVRINAAVLVGVLLAIPLLIHLSQGLVSLFFYDFGGILWGYLFGLLILKLASPFPAKKKREDDKIIDITSYQRQESDEEFMDRMLEKITTKGPASLTENEKDRMDAISRKRSR